MCDTLIARITSCVSSSRISVGDSPYSYSVAIRVNRMILVSLCAETIKPVSEGQNLTAVKGKCIHENQFLKKWPIIYFFSDDFGLRSPRHLKTMSDEKRYTFIVPRVPCGECRVRTLTPNSVRIASSIFHHNFLSVVTT